MTELSKKLIEFIEDPNKSSGLFADNLFCDINVPSWRFQIQGADDFIKWIKGHWAAGSKMVEQNSFSTPDGFGLEFAHEYNNRDGKPVYSRNIWLCKAGKDKIEEIILYCPGEWDEETRRRQAAEAPLIRK